MSDEDTPGPGGALTGIRAYAASKKPPAAPPPQSPRPAAPAGTTAYAAAAFTREIEALRTARETTRNATLNTAAYNLGGLVNAGLLDRQTVYDALYQAGRDAGLSHTEMVGSTGAGGTINSGLNSATTRVVPERTLRVAYSRPNPTDGDIPPPEEPEPEPPELNSSDFWNAREELTHIHTFAQARRACPWAVLGVVLARVITATPRWVVLPPLVGDDASLNLFVALVAPSGGGKGASEACAAAAVNVGKIDTAGVGSGEGIAHLFVRRATRKDEDGIYGVEQFRHAVLMRVGEIDTLAALGDRKGATLLPELRKAWSGEDLGFGYADPTKALPIPAHTYRLCLVAGVQPGRAQWVLDDEAGGTPQRFLWLPATDPHAPDVAPAAPVQMRWSPPRFAAADTDTERVVLHVCRTAAETIDTNRLARLRGDGESLDGHALLCRLKGAAALALLNGHPDVTEEDWDLAGVVSAVSEHSRGRIVATLTRERAIRNKAQAEAEATRAIVVKDRMDDASIKRVCRNILRQLGRPDSTEGIIRSDLRQRIRAPERPLFDEAIARLHEAGQVVPEEAEKGGTRWKLA